MPTPRLGIGRGYQRVCNTVYGGEDDSSCTGDLAIGPVSKLLESADFMAQGKVHLGTKRGEASFRDSEYGLWTKV